GATRSSSRSISTRRSAATLRAGSAWRSPSAAPASGCTSPCARGPRSSCRTCSATPIAPSSSEPCRTRRRRHPSPGATRRRARSELRPASRSSSKTTRERGKRPAMSNTANSTSVDDDSTDKLQRYRITVPSPKAWFHMGGPSDLGYQGVSLGADDHAFLSVMGSTLTQAKGQVNHVALMEWVQSSGGDMTLNTGGNQMMASKRQIILAAGTGSAPDLQLENGLSVPKAYFNPYDYQDLMEPCRLGVRAFDADMKDAVDNFNDDL